MLAKQLLNSNVSTCYNKNDLITSYRAVHECIASVKTLTVD